MPKYSDKIVEFLNKQGTIPEGQEAVVKFGIEQGIITAIEFAVILATGCVLHMFWESVIVLISFSSVRVYAGGYHAKTPLQCGIKSWLMYVGIIMMKKYIRLHYGYQLIILAGIGGVLYWKAPVEHENKPLKAFEFSKYKKRAMINYSLLFLVYIITYLLEIPWIYESVFWGLVMMAVLMIVGLGYKRIKK